MGDVDHRRTKRRAVRSVPSASARAGRVKVRQRFIEQKHLRVAHNRPADGDALALPARQRLGLAVHRGQLQDIGGGVDLAVISALGSLASDRPKPMFRAPSDADKARRIGTPSRCRAPTVPHRTHPGRRFRSCPTVVLQPAIMRSRVDLPQPDGPTNTQNSPASTVRSTPLMTSTAPKLLRNRLQDLTEAMLILSLRRRSCRPRSDD